MLVQVLQIPMNSCVRTDFPTNAPTCLSLHTPGMQQARTPGMHQHTLEGIHKSLYPDPFLEDTRSAAPAPSWDSAPTVIAPPTAVAVAAVATSPPITVGRPVAYPSIIQHALPFTEVLVHKGSGGRTGIVFAESRGPAVVAFLRASYPIASSEILFPGDRVASVNGCLVDSGRKAVKLIQSSTSSQIFLGIDTRETDTQTRVVDRGSRSSIGLAVCNADPLHALESTGSGQVVIYSVDVDSPADLAGLKAGDIVLSVEGVAATSALFTKEMINQTGRHVALTIRPPSSTELLWVHKKRGVPLGFALKDDQHTCVVHEVSRAHAALFHDERGLRINDVLLAINNTMVRSKDTAVELLRDLQGVVELRVMRAFPVVPTTTKSLSWSSSVR